jgi:hypothetical protein
MTDTITSRIILMPHATTFGDLFHVRTAEPRRWYFSAIRGTGGDARRVQCSLALSPRCAIRAEWGASHGSVRVEPKSSVLRAVQRAIRPIDGDTIAFDVTIWDNGRAQVSARSKRGGGEARLAVIDGASVPDEHLVPA